MESHLTNYEIGKLFTIVGPGPKNHLVTILASTCQPLGHFSNLLQLVLDYLAPSVDLGDVLASVGTWIGRSTDRFTGSWQEIACK